MCTLRGWGKPQIAPNCSITVLCGKLVSLVGFMYYCGLVGTSLSTRPLHSEEEGQVFTYMYINLNSMEFRWDESDWLITV